MKRTITITFDDQPGQGWNVHENGKHCDGLCWGEMIEQVTCLTIPQTRVGNGYAMHTSLEWKAKHEAWRRPKQAVPPLLLEGPAA